VASTARGTPGPLRERVAAQDRPDALGALWRQPGDPARRRHVGAVARLRNATATSAGGIVVDWRSGVPHLVVGMRRRERDSVTWTLPKGTPARGESTEQTALREVAEETGLQVRITRPLGSIEYWFVKRGARIHKTVHYFLMDPIGGDLSRHDHEFEQVRWIPFDEAPALLTFDTERALVERAAREIGWAADGSAGRPAAAAGSPSRLADKRS
jgi:8-oxo-dGTP pyrophosphatase MutT (NUDIX family)